MEKQKQQPQRLQSLDALRGFDMLFIMGGASLFVALATLFPNPFFQAIAGQMEHVEWNGLAHHDTIFPLFLFIAGISFPFSLEKQRGKGMMEGAIYKKIVRRGITLLFVRFGWKVRAGITVLILVGYWLAMAFVPVPDAGGAGPFTLEGNLVGYIDRLFLPGRLHETVFDPEGLFSTVPAIATAMLGMFTGEWIKLRKEGLTDRKKVLCLVGAGAVLLKLWTSSFVCVVGAYSVWMFALFFYIIDVLGWRKWTLFFTVIGMNSITIYLAQRFIRFSYTSEAIFGGLAKLMPETAQPLVSAIAYIAVCWGFLYFLYRQRIFLKV